MSTAFKLKDAKMEPISTVASAGLGLALAGYNDYRQMQQQKKLQKLQIKGQKELGIFNREQAYQQWKDTNYDAQRREMQKAGLNIGLMYQQGGAGGTTQGTGAGSVTGGNAPVGGGEVGMGIQLAMQAEMQKAQIENIKANTEATKASIPKTTKETEVAAANLENVKQLTNNAKVQGSIMEIEKQIADLELGIKKHTQTDIISQIQALRDTMIANAKIVENQADISTETKKSIIEGAKLAVIEQTARILATKTGITLTQEQIKKAGQEIMNMQVGLSQAERKLRLEQIATEFATGTDASGARNMETTKKFVNMFTDAIEALMPGN